MKKEEKLSSGNDNKASNLIEALKAVFTSDALIYVLKRFLISLVTIFAVITVTFFVMHAVPGGPFQAEKAISAEAEAILKEKYGLDKPLFTQYLTYLSDVVTRFDFGPSLKQRGRMCLDIILDGLSVSAKLGVSAALISLVTGTVLGAFAAVKRNSATDRIIMTLTTAFVSMPSFIMGTFLLMIFSLNLNWLPASAAGGGISGLILPTITLSLYPTAYITRLTRSSMLDSLGQDYIRTAKAKGASGGSIIFRHALKNSLIPVITYFGPMLAYIVTGSLVVEKIFAVPGIGRDFIGSITNRDYPLIMGTTIVLSILVVFMNFVSDMLYRAVDPRISLE
ncbi:MAG: ABC transporter permease [Clostridia bacterium]|nr:ABC transporter permease [Clostridia bacterium]